ncbi:helix-turn-helix transcriptional regulator [Ilumatobacter sp.]|uniref:helix-turn-helix transcriptional regulator n=1 Tax=Ilumatobacter sp. TaxID=1967498 RepID=UPI003B52A82D
MRGPETRPKASRDVICVQLFSACELVNAGFNSMLGRFPRRIRLVDLEPNRVATNVLAVVDLDHPLKSYELHKRLEQTSVKYSHVISYTHRPHLAQSAFTSLPPLVCSPPILSMNLSGAELVKQIQRIADSPAAASSAVACPASGKLTPRQVAVALLLVHGCSNIEIATQLKVSIETVKSHVSHILKRTGARNRTQFATLLLGL